MRPTSPTTPLQVPEIETDEPVAVIPTASVAPLDGPPDGERINTFTLTAPDDGLLQAEGMLGDVRRDVVRKPLTALAIAFAAGVVLARLFR